MRRVLVVLSTLFLLTACGGAPAELTDAERAEYEPRAAAMGVPLAYVYVTTVDGFARAAGGTGAWGDDTFQDIYANSGGFFNLLVDDTALTADSCASLPLKGAAAGTQTTCEQDGDGWYRTGSGETHEYAISRDGLLIRVSAATAVDRDTLKKAATEARPATADELDEILPECSGDCDVPRGDLPSNGDGAPVDPSHVGG